MSQFTINILFVGASFLLYFGIAIWARAGSTKEFYVAGGGVHPVFRVKEALPPQKMRYNA